VDSGSQDKNKEERIDGTSFPVRLALFLLRLVCYRASGPIVNFGGHELQRSLQRTRWRARGSDTAKKVAALPVGQA